MVPGANTDGRVKLVGNIIFIRTGNIISRGGFPFPSDILQNVLSASSLCLTLQVKQGKLFKYVCVKI